ncbi:hypothetical protein O0L34_g3496 [Tuta absoluta]|nr:hypothetical protein O0L34_g3496 [Tuta absoluta]
MEKFQKEVTNEEKITDSMIAVVGAREKEKNWRKVVRGLYEIQRVKDEKTPEAVRKLEEGWEVKGERTLKTIQDVKDEKSEKESVEGRDINDEKALEAELKLKENHNVKFESVEVATILENVRRRAKYKWIAEYLPLVMGATGLREAWKNEHGVEAAGKFELAGIQYTHEVDNPRGLEKEEGVNNEKEIEDQWGEEGARGIRQARRNEHEGEATKNDEGQEVNDEEEVDLWDEEEEENQGDEEGEEKQWVEEEEQSEIDENSEDNKVRENCNIKANSNFDNCGEFSWFSVITIVIVTI